MSKKRVAVVVGYHTYDVCALQEMFEGFEDLHCYVQHLEQFTSSPWRWSARQYRAADAAGLSEYRRSWAWLPISDQSVQTPSSSDQ